MDVTGSSETTVIAVRYHKLEGHSLKTIIKSLLYILILSAVRSDNKSELYSRFK
jgi:hypothetical protein